MANYVNLSYPGAGYAWPRLRLKADYNPDYPLHKQVEVFIDPLRTVDVGVWGVQIKINNTAIIHSVRLMGYPVLWYPLGDREDDDGKVVNYDSGYVFAPRPCFLNTLFLLWIVR